MRLNVKLYKCLIYYNSEIEQCQAKTDTDRHKHPPLNRRLF